MNALKARWQALAARFDAYSQRERAMIAAAVVGGIVMLGMTLLLDPQFAQLRQAEQATAQTSQDLSSTQTQLEAARTQLGADPNAAKRREVEALRKSLAAANASLHEVEAGLVTPENMNAVLERLLARNASVRLLSLKSLQPVNLAREIVDTQKSGDAVQLSGDLLLPGLFKHGVELQLEGSYADLMAWVVDLEAAPEKMLWGDVQFSVVEYPRSVLKLTVYTLNLEKSWLAI